MTVPGSAETANITATRGFMAGLEQHLQHDLQTKVTTVRATLTSRHVDPATLALIDRISTHLTDMAATCAAGVDHLDTYHANMEQAVNSTPEAADTSFYRPDTTTAPAVNERAEPGEPGEPGERSVRDRLARGVYIARTTRPDWRRDQAREWDAGNVADEHRDAAYEQADQILALWEQPGDGGERLAVMREHGIEQCPSWCLQDDDEHQYEAHRGRPLAWTTEDGDTVTVRPLAGWWSDDADVEVTLSGPSTADSGGAVVLTGRDLDHLQSTRREVLDSTLTVIGKPSYPGADAEAADAAHPTTDAAAAAAVLAQQDLAGGYYLSESDGADNPRAYLDWSMRPHVGVRNVEVGDGTNAVGIDLSTRKLQELHDGLGRAVDGRADDPGQLRGDDDDTYIDWSVVKDGVRCAEFGDGVDAVQLHLTNTQLGELRERLALQLHLDGQDPS